MTDLPPTASPLDEALGLVLEHAEGGVATLRLEPGPLVLFEEDGSTYLHGGALATCVDTAAWYAVASAAGGAWVVSSLSVDFVRLAGPGGYRVVGRCRRAGRTLAVADVEIATASDPDRLVALGRATLARLSG
jgi:uncharacterized protein (TIGR00369 family)